MFKRFFTWLEKRRHERLIKILNKPLDHSKISPFDVVLMSQNPKAFEQWQKNVELQNRDEFDYEKYKDKLDDL
jgi:hypothetical protein